MNGASIPWWMADRPGGVEIRSGGDGNNGIEKEIESVRWVWFNPEKQSNNLTLFFFFPLF